MHYIKQGSIVSDQNSEPIILKSEDGATYKVSYLTAFVWNSLDGVTSTDQIVTKVTSLAEGNENKIRMAMTEIINGLLQVNLIKTN